jgi:hypothetical protein
MAESLLVIAVDQLRDYLVPHVHLLLSCHGCDLFCDALHKSSRADNLNIAYDCSIKCLDNLYDQVIKLVNFGLTVIIQGDVLDFL